VNDAESGPTSFTTAERLFGLPAAGSDDGSGRMMCNIAPPFMVIVHSGAPVAHGSSVSR
jgi:hypothetical protein